MRTLSSLVLFAALLTGCAQGDPSRDPYADGDPDAILGGDEDLTTDAVVAVPIGVDRWCTGTLIAPRVVITAGHCIRGAGPAFVSFGSRPDADSAVRVTVTAVRVDPWFSPSAQPEHDVALLMLATEGPATPMPMAPAARDRFTFGHSIRIVGYGISTVDGEPGPTVRRSGTAHVLVADIKTFLTGPYRDANSACFGDSGGPAIVEIDGVEHLVGVTSTALGSTCRGNGFTRVKSVRDFIDPFLALVAASGTSPTLVDPCAELAFSCEVCTSYAGCGYCADTGACSGGSFAGPATGFCADWAWVTSYCADTEL